MPRSLGVPFDILTSLVLLEGAAGLLLETAENKRGGNVWPLSARRAGASLSSTKISILNLDDRLFCLQSPHCSDSCSNSLGQTMDGSQVRCFPQYQQDLSTCFPTLLQFVPCILVLSSSRSTTKAKLTSTETTNSR